MDKVFEQEVAKDIIQGETVKEQQTSLAQMRNQQEQQGECQPDRTFVAEQTDDQQRLVEQFALEMKLYEVQDHKVDILNHRHG